MLAALACGTTNVEVRKMQTVSVHLEASGYTAAIREWILQCKGRRGKLNDLNVLSDIFLSDDSPYYEYVLKSNFARFSGKIAVPISLYPERLLRKFVHSIRKEDLENSRYIASIATRYFSIGLVSDFEYLALNSQTCVDHFDGDFTIQMFDRIAPFERIGINFGAPGVHTIGDIERVIKTGPERFYVYKLLTPTGLIFYVGKGIGTRILDHEKEIYSTHFRTHTNWKKLNKIAAILSSNKKVGYVIDTWHRSDDSAHIRENELILIHERRSPQVFTNSNGQRWRGNPSSALITLREKRGLK